MNVVLFLDDNVNRQAHAREWLGATIVSTAAGCIEMLKTNWFQRVCLDHDLGGEVYVDSDREDCGMEVVRWLINEGSNKFINTIFVIHTHNHTASAEMGRRLLEAGFIVTRRPYPVVQ